MKRIFFTFSILLLLVSCGDSKKQGDSSTSGGEVSQKDSKGNKFGIWEVHSYVDDFGEPTDSKYIITNVDGVFSNSATTDSKLRVDVVIDKESIRFDLYEYARNHPTKGEGFVRFKARGNDSELEFKTYNGDSGANWVQEDDYQQVKDLLLAGGEIKFIGVADKYSKSEYKFTIKNTDKLKEALSSAGM